MATPQKHVRISSPSLGKKTPSVPHEILVVQCISAAMVKGMDIGDPAIEDLNAWLMENATREESFAQLRYLHSRSMHQHVRRDTNPAFFSRLERLFSKDAYTAWSLCLGYPPETPWLQEVISTQGPTSWDAVYAHLFTGPDCTCLYDDIALLLAFGSDTQLVDAYHRWVVEYQRDKDDHYENVSYLESMLMVLRSPRAEADTFLYGLAHMGQLEMACEDSLRVGSHSLAQDPLLRVLSSQRRRGPHSMDPTFPELALFDTPSQWAEYMCMKARAPQVMVKSPCDLSYST